MNWNSWSEFFAMGGYALYVWGSLSVTVALLLGELLQLRWRGRAARDEIAWSQPTAPERSQA
jgi:heme exporter protein D